MKIISTEPRQHWHRQFSDLQSEDNTTMSSQHSRIQRKRRHVVAYMFVSESQISRNTWLSIRSIITHKRQYTEHENATVKQ